MGSSVEPLYSQDTKADFGLGTFLDINSVLYAIFNTFINSGLLCFLAYLACEVDVLSAIKVFRERDLYKPM